MLGILRKEPTRDQARLSLVDSLRNGHSVPRALFLAWFLLIGMWPSCVSSEGKSRPFSSSLSFYATRPALPAVPRQSLHGSSSSGCGRAASAVRANPAFSVMVASCPRALFLAWFLLIGMWPSCASSEGKSRPFRHGRFMPRALFLARLLPHRDVAELRQQ